MPASLRAVGSDLMARAFASAYSHQQAMVINGVNFPEQPIAEFCRRNAITRLSLFGSAIRDDFSPESDIDLLVEFHPTVRVSLFDLGGMAVELTELLGRQVDLRTREDLSRYFRSAVLSEAKTLYAA